MERDEVRWYTDEDLAQIYTAFAQRHNGLIHRDRAWWNGHIRPGETFAVVAHREGVVTGYAFWDQIPAPRGEFTFRHRVRAREIVASTVPAARALLHALGQAGSPGEEISWFGGPSDGLARLFDAPVLMDWVHPWMTKILDYPAVLAARGYHSFLDLTLVLRIGNGPTLRLAVRDGRCQVEETTAEPDVTVDEATFAAVFTGHASAHDARLDALFAGTAPWFFEHF